MQAANQLHLPGPKDRPGWQRFIFGTPTPPQESPAVDNDGVEGPDKLDILNTQPMESLDIDDASTSDEEHGPSPNEVQNPAWRDGNPTLSVSHNLVDHKTGGTTTESYSEHLHEPSLALLRRLNQVRIMDSLSYSVYHSCLRWNVAHCGPTSLIL